KFVAEAKFQDPQQHSAYVSLIKSRDRAGIEALLTNKAVEDRVLRRLRKKALIYGREVEDDDELDEQGTPSPTVAQAGQGKMQRIAVDVVADMYERFVIPLTKEVEVDYLLERLNHPDFMPDLREMTKGFNR
ncbi:chorismate mutase aro7, partial [Irineochytrium annulatum]